MKWKICILKTIKYWCGRIDAFEPWCWRRLLRVPWTARRSNESILKEISPGCSWRDCWSWNSNTLATWCRELTDLKRPRCWERLKAGGEGNDRGWDGWMASLTQWTWVWVDSGSWWWTGRPGVLRFMGSQRVRHDWATILNWTEIEETKGKILCSWIRRITIFKMFILTEAIYRFNSISTKIPRTFFIGMCRNPKISCHHKISK